MGIIQVSPEDGKTCVGCGLWKPLTGYHRNHKAKGGYASKCKTCRQIYTQSIAATARERAMRWQAEHPERVREHRAACRKKILTRDPSYYKESLRKSRAEHPERYRENEKRWRLANKEKVARTANLYYRRHLERILSDRRAYAKQHPEYSARTSLRYIARKKGASGFHTPAEWRALCDRYDWRCLCCGSKKPLAADHVIPLSKGGDDTINNIQPLCQSCNSRKATKTIDYRKGFGYTNHTVPA